MSEGIELLERDDSILIRARARGIWFEVRITQLEADPKVVHTIANIIKAVWPLEEGTRI